MVTSPKFNNFIWLFYATMGNQQNTAPEKQDLILATTSPYRLEIFKKLGLHFTSE
jgi:hypothetical protein